MNFDRLFTFGLYFWWDTSTKFVGPFHLANFNLICLYVLDWRITFIGFMICIRRSSFAYWWGWLGFSYICHPGKDDSYKCWILVILPIVQQCLCGRLQFKVDFQKCFLRKTSLSMDLTKLVLTRLCLHVTPYWIDFCNPPHCNPNIKHLWNDTQRSAQIILAILAIWLGALIANVTNIWF